MNTRIDIRHDIDRDNSIAADRDQLAVRDPVAAASRSRAPYQRL